MPGLDLNAILQSIAVVNNQQNQGAQQIAGLLDSGAGIAAGIADNTLKSGVLAADAQRTTAEYQLHTEQQNLSLANAYGTNQGAASDMITGIGNAMRATGEALIRQQGVVSDIEAGSDLLGNPLGWLRDLVTGDEERAKLSGLQNQFNTLSEVNKQLNAATQIGVQTQNAIQQTLNQDSIDKLAEAGVAAAQAKADEAKLNSIQFQVQGVQTLMAAGADEFQRNVQGYNLALQAEQLAESRANRALQLKELKRKEQAELEENAYFQNVAERIKQGAALTGRAEVNITPEEALRTYKSGGPRAAILQELEQIGFGLQEQGGSATGILGKDPVEAATRFAQLGGRGEEGWKENSLRVIETALATAQQGIAARGVKPTPEMLSQEVKAQIANQVRAGTRNVSQSRGDYNAIPPLPVILQNQDKILDAAGKKFANAVLVDMIAAGNENPEAELIISTAIKKVQEGQLTERDFKDGLHNFYANAVNLKAATGGYNAFALPMPDSYFISADRVMGDKSWGARLLGLTTPSIIAGAAKTFSAQVGLTEPEQVRFDLTKKADYDTLFTMIMSQERAARILEGANQ